MGAFYYHTIRLPFYLGELNCELQNTFRSRPDDRSSVLPVISHKHLHEELHYVISGNCTFYSGCQRFDLTPGMLLYVPPETEHRLADHTADFCRLIINMRILPPAVVKPDSPSMALYNTLRPGVPVLLEATRFPDIMAPLSAFLAVEVEGRLPFERKEVLRANASLLLLAIANAISCSHEPSSLPYEHLTLQHAIIEDFFTTFYYRMSVCAEDLARLLHVSPRQLDRILKRDYGMGFRDKLNAVRLDQATKALTETGASIREVSDSLGFSCVTAFGSFIKSQTGMTPSQLRRSYHFASPDQLEE